MAQKDAIIEALRRLGGKAKMGDICKQAQQIGDFSGSQNPNATIRNCIYTHPHDFRSSEQKDYWELLSFQEEIASRDHVIRRLQDKLVELEAVPTEDNFVRRIVAEAKILYRHDSVRMDAVRQLLHNLDRDDAVEELDTWIEGREKGMTVVNTQVYNKEVMRQEYRVASPLMGNQEQSRLTDGR